MNHEEFGRETLLVLMNKVFIDPSPSQVDIFLQHSTALIMQRIEIKPKRALLEHTALRSASS